MASLTDKRIKNTYDGLLKTTDNDALGGSYKLITDGLGNSSNVYLGTGGNVGIGASPSTKLHITDNSDSIIRIQRTGSHDLQLNSDGTITATSTDIKLVASSYISFTADFSEHMRVTGLGNVGIGTDTPGAKLHVSTGNDSNSGNIEFVIGGTNLSNARTASLIKNTSSPYELTIQSSNNPTGSSHLIFKTSGSDERMRIRSDGNIGIGTSSPGHKLTVLGGNIQTDGIVYANTIRDNTGGNVVIQDNSGNVGIGTTNPERQLSLYSNNSETTPRFLIEQDGTGDAVMAFSLTGGQGWSMGIDNSLSDSFMIHNSSGGVDSSSQFTIDTSGNVGIGTVSPTSTTLLHISTPQSGAAAGTGLTISGWNGSTESRVQFMSYGIGGGTFALRTGTSNTERMRIDSDGNVGIGTSSPNYELTVGGGSINSIQILSSSTGSGATDGLRFWNTGNSTAMFNYDNTPMLFGTNGSERMRIDSSGNVGIGTTSPDATLEVQKGSEGNYLIVGGDNASNARALIFSSSTAISNGALHTINAQSGNGQIAFKTGGTEALRIDSSQNIGIGTSSPTSKLHVRGDNPVININDSNSTSRYAALNLSTAGGTWRISSGDSTTGTSSNLFITRADDGTSNRFIFDRDLYYFAVYDNTNTQKIRLRASGNSYFAGGNVGIGTTSPSNKLEIVGEYSSTPLKILRHGDYGNVINLGRNGVSETAHIGYPSDATINFSTGGTERMRIDSSGNVGIGTTSPVSPLTVKSNSVSSGNSGLRIEANGSTDAIALIGEKSGNKARLHMYNAGVEKIAFYTDGTNNHISAGNLGIGTTSPNTTLEVGDCDSSTYIDDGNIAVKTNTNDTAIVIQEASGAEQWGLGVNVDGDLIFTDSGTERIRIDDNTGHVGIGTTAPTYKLDVEASANILAEFKSTTNKGAIAVRDDDTIAYISAENSRIGFGTSPSLSTQNITMLTGNNYVGIGTTSPSQKLHVKADDATLLLQDSTTGFSSQASGIILTSTDGSGNPRTDVQYKLKVNSNTFEITYGASDSQRLKIDSDGGLFVPSLLGSSDSNPDVRYNTTTGELYYNSSSIRYKEDVTDIESTIDKINKLRPVKFKVKESQKYTTGLIAEEVVDVLPELVFKRQIEGFEEPQIEGVVYNDLHAYYIKAIQEQQEMINELKTEIQTLKSQINS